MTSTTIRIEEDSKRSVSPLNISEGDFKFMYTNVDTTNTKKMNWHYVL